MARIETRNKSVKSLYIFAIAGALLGGCSLATDALWPSLKGEDPRQNTTAKSSPPPRVTKGSATGTYVGQRVVELRRELKRLQSQIGQQNRRLQAIRSLTVQHSRIYHTTVGAVNAR